MTNVLQGRSRSMGHIRPGHSRVPYSLSLSYKVRACRRASHLDTRLHWGRYCTETSFPTDSSSLSNPTFCACAQVDFISSPLVSETYIAPVEDRPYLLAGEIGKKSFDRSSAERLWEFPMRRSFAWDFYLEKSGPFCTSIDR